MVGLSFVVCLVESLGRCRSHGSEVGGQDPKDHHLAVEGTKGTVQNADHQRGR